MSRGLITLLCLGALSACEEKNDLYKVTLSLESNTCGIAALPLPDGFRYSTELEPDPPKATWKPVPQGAPISGTIDDEGAFKFMVSQTLNLSPMDAGQGLLLCTVIRSETLTGTLDQPEDGGSPRDPGDGGVAVVLRGKHVIDFSADPNGSCAGATGPLGVFERLPCEARYGLQGTAQKPR